jgi:hypothetical protein
MTTRPHTVRKTIVEDGYRAPCACGWHTTRRTRELRDRDADTHQCREHG